MIDDTSVLRLKREHRDTMIRTRLGGRALSLAWIVCYAILGAAAYALIVYGLPLLGPMIEGWVTV